MQQNKTRRPPLFAERLWRKHRNKHQTRAYWGKQRREIAKEIEKVLSEEAEDPSLWLI